MKKLSDKFGRVHDYLKFSVTDKSNLRRSYCDQENKTHKALRKRDMLSIDESLRIIKIFINDFGFKKIRFTGGEPLLKKDFLYLLEKLKELRSENDFITALTTNATLLFDKLSKLKKSGVSRLNINLDTLDGKKFFLITGKDKFAEVMNSLNVAAGYGFDKVKINCLVVKGVNDEEIPHFAAFAYLNNINVRFIECRLLTPVAMKEKSYIPVSRIKDIVGSEHNISIIENTENEVAENYRILGTKGTVSFIRTLDGNFCEKCNRLRITPDGHLKLCMYSRRSSELDLKPLLRDSNYSDSDISRLIDGAIKIKKDRHPPLEELIQLKLRNMISPFY